MGLMDKLKNVLFEEEYVEVEEEVKPVVKKKEKVKKEVEKVEKPVAKKVSSIKKKTKMEEPVFDEDEEELLEDDDFDIETPVHTEEKLEPFKFPMVDDDDFKYEEPKPVEKPKIIPKEEEVKAVQPKVEEKPLYKGTVENNDYVNHEYGSYEKKQDKTYFKPSPVISPVYGVLDKNYKKEEVKDKKEIHLSTSFSRENLDVDEVRNKAFGHGEKSPSFDTDLDIFADDEDEDENLLVDLSVEKKPEVKVVTMGDAEEYYSDLGLEYNIDYKDTSKAKASGRRVKEENPVLEVEENEEIEDTPVIEDNSVEEVVEEHAPKRKQPTGINSEEEENLFDLIDSMYDKD